MRSSFWLWAATCSAVIAVASGLLAFVGERSAWSDVAATGLDVDAAASQIDEVKRRLQSFIPQAIAAAPSPANPASVEPTLQLWFELQARQQAELREAIKGLESSLVTLRASERAARPEVASTTKANSLAMIGLVPAFLGAFCTIATLALAIHKNRREREEALLKFEQMRLQIEDLRRKLSSAGGSAA